MIDLRLISFWLLAFAAIYFIGPVSIYFIGILALLCSLCSSSLSSAGAANVKVIKLNGPNQNLFDSSLGNQEGTQGRIIRVNNVDGVNVVKVSKVPAIPSNSFVQCGGNYGYGNDGFDMTADQVYTAFRQHPYDGKNLGYGYYDGYDYVL